MRGGVTKPPLRCLLMEMLISDNGVSMLIKWIFKRFQHLYFLIKIAIVFFSSSLNAQVFFDLEDLYFDYFKYDDNYQYKLTKMPIGLVSDHVLIVQSGYTSSDTEAINLFTNQKVDLSFVDSNNFVVLATRGDYFYVQTSDNDGYSQNLKLCTLNGCKVLKEGAFDPRVHNYGKPVTTLSENGTVLVWYQDRSGHTAASKLSYFDNEGVEYNLLETAADIGDGYLISQSQNGKWGLAAIKDENGDEIYVKTYLDDDGESWAKEFVVLEMQYQTNPGNFVFQDWGYNSKDELVLMDYLDKLVYHQGTTFYPVVISDGGAVKFIDKREPWELVTFGLGTGYWTFSNTLLGCRYEKALPYHYNYTAPIAEDQEWLPYQWEDKTIEGGCIIKGTDFVDYSLGVKGKYQYLDKSSTPEDAQISLGYELFSNYDSYGSNGWTTLISSHSFMYSYRTSGNGYKDSQNYSDRIGNGKYYAFHHYTGPSSGNFIYREIGNEPGFMIEWFDKNRNDLPDAWETYFAPHSLLASGDEDNDGLTNLQEYEASTHPLLADTDGDGRSDSEEINAGTNPWLSELDTDADGIIDGIDTDDDNDGVLDVNDAFPLNALESVDSDGDGVGNNTDLFPNDPSQAFDSDDDGVGDELDRFPNNALETKDTDGDGIGDNADAFPQNPKEQKDSDGDGIGDNADAFINFAAASIDADNDGLPDSWNPGCDLICQSASGLVLDAYLDDFDNDGYKDVIDLFPADPNEWQDSDGDGVGDNSDAFINNAAAGVDDDNDGFPDAWAESCIASCRTQSGLVLDSSLNDFDNDGFTDDQDAFVEDPTEWLDSDGDGIGNNEDAFDLSAVASLDADNDGLPDAWLDGCLQNPVFPLMLGDITLMIPELPCNTNDGLTLDRHLNDSDNDGYSNDIDVFPTDPKDWIDSDGDGVGDNTDAFVNDASEWMDSDGDGYGDNSDAFPQDKNEWQDMDADGVGDNSDAFMNNAAASIDADMDGLPDEWNAACDASCQATSNLTLDPSKDDFDNDGSKDSEDVFYSDPTEWLDSDGDGVGDNADAFPNNAVATVDADSDGKPDEWLDGCLQHPLFPLMVGDITVIVPEMPCLENGGLFLDLDSDNDGVNDKEDVFPNDASEWQDSDGDGVGDNGDAFPLDETETLDSDGDGFGDNYEVRMSNAGFNPNEYTQPYTEYSDRDFDGMDDEYELLNYENGLNPAIPTPLYTDSNLDGADDTIAYSEFRNKPLPCLIDEDSLFGVIAYMQDFRMITHDIEIEIRHNNSDISQHWSNAMFHQEVVSAEAQFEYNSQLRWEPVDLMCNNGRVEAIFHSLEVMGELPMCITVGIDTEHQTRVDISPIYGKQCSPSLRLSDF